MMTDMLTQTAMVFLALMNLIFHWNQSIAQIHMKQRVLLFLETLLQLILAFQSDGCVRQNSTVSKN